MRAGVANDTQAERTNNERDIHKKERRSSSRNLPHHPALTSVQIPIILQQLVLPDLAKRTAVRAARDARRLRHRPRRHAQPHRLALREVDVHGLHAGALGVVEGRGLVWRGEVLGRFGAAVFGGGGGARGGRTDGVLGGVGGVGRCCVGGDGGGGGVVVVFVAVRRGV